MKSERSLALGRAFILPFTLCYGGIWSMTRSWADLTRNEGIDLLTRVYGVGYFKAFAEKGLKVGGPKIESKYKEDARKVMSQLNDPIELSAEAVEILGSMVDGLTFRQRASIQACSIALDIIEMRNNGWSLAKIGKTYEEDANVIRDIIAGLGYTSSADYSEDNILKAFSNIEAGELPTSLNTSLRRANFPTRDWGSVVVNNGFKVTDGLLEGDVVEAFGNSRPIDGRWWRVIPVSIPTLEEAIETILEWGCGL